MLRESVDIWRFSLPISKNITYRCFLLSPVEASLGLLYSCSETADTVTYIHIHTHIHIYSPAGSIPFRLHLLCLFSTMQEILLSIICIQSHFNRHPFFSHDIARKSVTCKLLTTHWRDFDTRLSIVKFQGERTRVRTKFDTPRGGKWKIHPFTRFRRVTYRKRVGYWPNAGCRVRQAIRGRKRPYVRLYMWRHMGGGREGRGGRGREEAVVGAEGCQRVERNGGGGGAGGDKAPQCGAVDTTTTTHPRPLFEDLSLHPGLPTSFLCPLSLPFSFYISE